MGNAVAPTDKQRKKAQELLSWMQQSMPHVYKGVVQRFSSAPQLSGFWDSVSNVASGVVNSVSNFMNTQGAQSLLQVAQPFIQSQIEKQQLQLQIQRQQAGLPLQYPMDQQQSYYTLGPTGVPIPLPEPGSQPQIPWLWIGAGTLGVLGLLLLGRR